MINIGGAAGYWHLLSVISPNGRNVKIIQIDDLSVINEDPFNRASITNPLGYIITNTTIQLRLLGVTNGVFDVHYLHHPAQPFEDGTGDGANFCANIPIEYHVEIVERTVRKMLSQLESPAYESQSTEIGEYNM